MRVFPWARRPIPERTINLPPDKPLYVISDVHLGDGSRSDAFVGKDQVFLDLLKKVRLEKAHLVILGDMIDFPQALTFTRVVRAHGPMLRALSEIADTSGVTYVWGNHDFDMAMYRDLLRWNVCSSVLLGNEVRLEHGHRLDPYISENLKEAAMATLVHHQLERLTGSWIRVPLEHFYTFPNRLTWWALGRAYQASLLLSRVLARIGIEWKNNRLADMTNYWVRSELGDSMCLFGNARRALLDGPHRILVCGHTHLPGIVAMAHDRYYLNTGSWTFKATQYAHWNGRDFTLQDWVSGRTYDDSLYSTVMSGAIEGTDANLWWSAEYMGWLRFRCGELYIRGLPIPSWESTRKSLTSPGQDQ